MSEFEKLGINPLVLKAIDEQNFEKPSEIQKKAIPLTLQNKDIIAGSATGSGKTLAFGAGIIQNSQKGMGIQALILTPTRELAEQIKRELKKFSKYKPLNIIEIYGGMSINPQIDKLRTADVVVGTPGRILDHMQRRTIDLSKVSILVLDEGDRMLDMGFIDDVEMIIRKCKKDRQTMLFSATVWGELEHLANKYMKGAVKISVESYVDPKKLKQVYYDISEKIKLSLLVHLLKHEHIGTAMVFCNSRINTDFVSKTLVKNGLDSLAIHGGMSQDKRSKTLEKFHNNKFHVMVCTDVAARGLDIKGVTHIYNYDIPKESKQYIHRIGRTARAGKEGMAINLLSERDYDNYQRILRDFDVRPDKLDVPDIERAVIPPRQSRNRGGHSRFGDRGPRRGGQGRGHSRQGSSRGQGGQRRSSSGQRSSNSSRPGQRSGQSPNRGQGGQRRGSRPRGQRPQHNRRG